MGAGSAEIWVCANCRSVNKARAKQCYNCRTPRDLAAVDPAQMEVTGHGQVREVALPRFRSSRGRAVLASLLVGAVAGLEVASKLFASGFVVGILEGAEVTDEQVLVATNLGLASLVIALLALVVWALWLSRVVTEMPALGLGYPAATGLTAFVENFVPLLNLFRVPAIVRDIVRRLDPHTGRGDALISAAWIGIFGGYLIPRVGAIVNAFGATSLDMALRNQLVVEGIATGLVVVGALFLIALIWWVETRIAGRRREQEAMVLFSTPRPGTTSAGRTPDPLTVHPALADAEASSPGVSISSEGVGQSIAADDALPAELLLVVRAQASGALVAELGGGAETVTLDELRAAAHALSRARGSATVQVVGQGDRARAAAREAFGVLSGAGVPTVFEG